MKEEKQHKANLLPVPYLPPEEREARRERLINSVLLGISLGGIGIAAVLAWDMVRALMPAVVFGLCLIVVAIQTWRAITEKAPLPAPAGKEVECAHVNPSDFARAGAGQVEQFRAKQQAKEFERTEGYAGTRQGSFHIYDKDQDINYEAEEKQVDEDTFETEYKLKK